MLHSMMNALFGCGHQRTTFPITPGRKSAISVARNGTYVVCLDCGKEFAYDWKSMRVGEPMTAIRSPRQGEPLEVKA
jgi:hypothetical protein